MQHLLEGYDRFTSGALKEQRERYEALGRGQSPRVMVIGCADSRVDPATIFDQPPGELFVVRNVANVVPPNDMDAGQQSVASALEFAVTVLGIETVLVMGHASCGGVQAARTQSVPRDTHIGKWVGLLDDARARLDEAGWPEDEDEAQLALELMGVRVSLDRLKEFPFVKERLDAGTLTLEGAHFGIAKGELRVLQDDGSFRTL